MQLFGCFSAGQGSAACELLFVSAVQFSLLFSGHTGLLGLGGYASPPLVSYGQLCFLVNGFIWVQTDNEAIGRTKHFNSRPDQCNRITGARRLYGISCSAALICEFCATRRIRFLSLFCFRPFPETTFLERRRCRGAVLSSKKRKKEEKEKRRK